jgi:endonuclease/exonuclease/phosphatase family metal-dependent hydrolase
VTSELDLLTVNLWGLPWPFARARLERKQRLAAHLAEGAYDLVGIQELWWPWRRAFEVPALQVPRSRRDSGLALAGRLRARNDVRVAHFRHHRGSDRLKRKGVLWAEVETPDAGTLRVGVTHLQAERRGARIRALQIEEIIARVEAERAPVLLMGDFNFYADSEEDVRSAERLCAAGLVDAALALGREEPTYGVNHPYARGGGAGERFDRVYLRAGARASLHPLDAEVIGVAGGAVSDHHPVRVRVRIGDAG